MALCENQIDCCQSNLFSYDSTIPDPAPEPVPDDSCPTCTEDVVGNCILTPPDVPDLDTWLRAYEGVYEDAGGTNPAENGDVVLRWDDQSGQGINLTDGAYLPGMTFHTNVHNGLPVVRAGVALDGSLVESSGSLINTTSGIVQPEVIIMALRFNSAALWPDGSNRNAVLYDTGGTNVLQVRRNGDGSIFIGQTNQVTGVDVQGYSGGNVAINEFVIIATVFNGASSFFRINNGPKVEGDTGNPTNSIIRIGGRSTQTQAVAALSSYGICDYCEIAKFSRLLTDAEIFGVVNFLSETWDIPIS